MNTCCNLISLLTAVGAALALNPATASAQGDPPADEFLFAKTSMVHNFSDCAGDVLSIANVPSIMKFKEALGLESVAIDFQGCPNAEFSMRASPGPRRDLTKYVIYYPVIPDASLERYIPPIAHEIAHVYQTSAYGSVGKFKSAVPNPELIELEADFLAGLVSRKIEAFSIAEYHGSFDLVGHFRPSSEPHGTPVQRSNAFRLGYFRTSSASTDGEAIRNTSAQFREEDYFGLAGSIW